MTTDPNTETARALLRDAENYLSALHGSVARHDNLAANLGCAGCELRDQIGAVLATPAAGLGVSATPSHTDQAAHPCNAAVLHRLGSASAAHGPHQWTVQSGMEPVHCPGTEAPATDQAARRERDSLGREADRLRTEWTAMRDRAERAEADRDWWRDRAYAVQARAERADRATVLAEVLPNWEAVYEPGNVSDYLIGYANDQDAATGMAEAWMRSQAEVTGRLEWVSEERMATGRYDRWFELIERHDDGIDTGPGIIVRRRLADEAPQPEPDDPTQCSGEEGFCPEHGFHRHTLKQPGTADRAAVLADDEGDELVCVDQCGSCDACGMEPFGTPAEGWRQAAHFLRRTARESSDRQGALHGARLIEAELRRLADETQQQPTACPQCGDTGACNGGPCALTSPAAPVPEPPVHGESVAHLASLHDDEQEQSETETLRTPAAGHTPTELRVRVLREILNRLDGSRSDGDSATQDVGASTVRAVLADILADMQPAAGEQQDGAEA
jgi:hypothetical protein